MTTTPFENAVLNVRTARQSMEETAARLANLSYQPSSFGIANASATLATVVMAATDDVLSRAAARLRALHEPASEPADSSPKTAFGEPAVGPVITAEYERTGND